MSRRNPFLRPGETPQQTGRRYETFWAKKLGTEPTRGSGNQWTAPMDVGDGKILWSLKHSSVGTLRWASTPVKVLIAEIRGHLKGDPDTIPALGLHDEEGSAWVVLSADDFLRLVQQGDFKYVVASKGEQKRLRARVPSLLRDDEDG